MRIRALLRLACSTHFKSIQLAYNPSVLRLCGEEPQPQSRCCLFWDIRHTLCIYFLYNEITHLLNPHFFSLALTLSNFKSTACGSSTRAGVAGHMAVGQELPGTSLLHFLSGRNLILLLPPSPSRPVWRTCEKY